MSEISSGEPCSIAEVWDIYIYIYVCICVYVCMCVCVYIYIYIYSWVFFALGTNEATLF